MKKKAIIIIIIVAIVLLAGGTTAFFTIRSKKKKADGIDTGGKQQGDPFFEPDNFTPRKNTTDEPDANEIAAVDPGTLDQTKVKSETELEVPQEYQQTKDSNNAGNRERIVDRDRDTIVSLNSDF